MSIERGGGPSGEGFSGPDFVSWFKGGSESGEGDIGGSPAATVDEHGDTVLAPVKRDRTGSIEYDKTVVAFVPEAPSAETKSYSSKVETGGPASDGTQSFADSVGSGDTLPLASSDRLPQMKKTGSGTKFMPLSRGPEKPEMSQADQEKLNRIKADFGILLAVTDESPLDDAKKIVDRYALRDIKDDRERKVFMDTIFELARQEDVKATQQAFDEMREEEARLRRPLSAEERGRMMSEKLTRNSEKYTYWLEDLAEHLNLKGYMEDRTNKPAAEDEKK